MGKLDTLTVGVIGCGNMGGAIAAGLLRAGVSVCLFDHDRSKIEKLSSDNNATVGSSAVDVVEQSDCIVLALKPYVIVDALAALSSKNSLDKVWISVAAGVSLSEITNVLGADSAVVRVMPNLPCTIGKGVSGIFGEVDAHCEIAEEIFAVVGSTVRVKKESDIDIVTALGGSGPGFVAYLISGLIDGAVSEGLDPDVARTIALDTFAGTAALLRETGEKPSALAARVATPGGTTEAGLEILKGASVETTLSATISAASKWASANLSKKKS